MKKLWKWVLPLLLIFLGGAVSPAASQEAPRMPVEELRARLTDPEIFVLDVRIPEDWENSDAQIPGAIREDPRRIDWAAKYPKDATLVLYCS